MPGSPLAGLRVLDLTDQVAGPYCTKLLADFGADVIKIEAPGRGDRARTIGPFPGDVSDDEQSGAFLFLNTNKRSVTLDIASRTGLTLLKQLIAQADVVVEAFKPGVMASLGLGYEALAAKDPRLIVTSITSFGQDGPYRDFEATEIVVDALGGWLNCIGVPEREPIKPVGMQAQMVTGIFGYMGTLTAYLGREISDQGQHVDVSMMEAVTSILQNVTTTYEYSGRIFKRTGDRSTMNHPQGVFNAKDGPLGCNVLYFQEWLRFCDFLGHPEWKTEPQLKTPIDRARNAHIIDDVMRPWLSERTAAEAYHSAQRAKIPFAMINSPADLVASAHLQARGYFVDVPHHDLGSVRMPGAPFKLSETPWSIRRPVPRLGEHTHEVLSTSLGLKDADIRRLREREII